jgi:nitrite reductase (NADH) small subunit
MIEPRWIRIAAVEQVPPREGRAVAIGDREIAIFNLVDRFFATDNRCPHKAGPLCDGIVSGDAIVCPLHAWKIDLGSGRVERPSVEHGCVRTYAVRVEDGVLAIALPDGAAAIGGEAA